MTSNVATAICAGLLVVTALVHSILGERRLLGPLLDLRIGILDHSLARFLLRFVWHFMSVLFAIIAVTLLVGLSSAETARITLLGATSVGVGGAGVFDALSTRGRHVGWPLLVLIGVFALLGLVLGL